MGRLEKSTHVATAGSGRLAFRKSGEDLEIQYIDAENTVRDSGTLSEDDLRSLLKDNFKGTREPKRSAKTTTNGKPKGRATEAHA